MSRRRRGIGSPGTRAEGWDRATREHPLKDVMRFRKVWLGIFLAAFVLFLLSTYSGQEQRWNFFEQLIVEAVAPVQKLFHRAVHSTEEFWLNYLFLVDLRKENQQLRRRVDALKMENSRYREMLATHHRLRSLLQFKQKFDRPAIAGQVTGRDPSGWFRSVIIDKGRNSGLKIDMPVLNASGVVGKVVSVSPNFSKVLLIIDQNSAVDCLVQRSRDRGMVRGQGSEICKMDYVVDSSDVRVGDLVVTSGLGGIFPKGIPVGRVEEVREGSGNLFKQIHVRTIVDFGKLEEVLVILAE